MSKLIEEMGEALQVLGKLIGNNGAPDHWDGTNLHERLVEELADVLAAIDFFVVANDIDVAAVGDRSFEKLQKFVKWDQEQKPV